MSKRQKISLSVIALGLGLSISSASAGVLPCEGQLAVVTGSVTSFNISPTQQQGQISLVLTPSTGGDPIFSDSQGLISGEIQNQHGIISRLNHQMLFSSGEELNTKNDIAISKLPPISFEADGTACAFNVFEAITHISGTGVFERAKGAIFAEGTISFCSYHNQNNLNLSGLVCLSN